MFECLQKENVPDKTTCWISLNPSSMVMSLAWEKFPISILPIF